MPTNLKNKNTQRFHSKNVAVIGAGPSGLTAVKTLLEEGHEVTCFEKSQDIGGVYRYAKDSIGVYASAQLTSSAVITSFSDFPPHPNASFHLKHQEYFQYLRDYAAQFGLMPFIKLNHAVKSLKQLPDTSWQLISFDQINQKEEQYIFDAVAVCAGVHQNLSIPQIPHKEVFQGDIIHSGLYKTPDAFKDKKVVIVGGGESGSDIVEEISQVARQCFVSLRRGVLIIPRLILGKPNDFYTTRLLYTVPDWVMRIRHKRFHWPTLFICLLILISSVVFFHFILILADISSTIDLILFVSLIAISIYLLIKVSHYIFVSCGLNELAIIGQLNRQSLAGHGEQFATKCQGIAKAIANKKCTLKPSINQFTSNGVEFEDKTTCEADAVIFCTGYVTNYPFLNIERLDCRTLYKNCFDPNIGSSLCFIGLARPGIGAIPPISEMQSRWFAQILSGTVQLPTMDVILSLIIADAQRHRKCFAVVSDRITGLVNFTSYMDELAELIGCKPKWKDLCKNPFVLYRVYFNPFLACQYRLYGPYAKIDLAKKIMASIPIDIFQFVFNCFLAYVTFLCAILHRLGFRYFKPNLSL